MPSEVHPEDCRSIFGCAGPKNALDIKMSEKLKTLKSTSSVLQAIRTYKKERKKTIHAFSDVPRRKCP